MIDASKFTENQADIAPLTLLYVVVFQWQKQDEKYGGLMLKMNFTCDTTAKETTQTCIILKIKGTYDTRTNKSISRKLNTFLYVQVTMPYLRKLFSK